MNGARCSDCSGRQRVPAVVEVLPPLSGKRLLYVENDPLDVLALTRSFEKLGAQPQVEVSGSAELALARLEDMPDEELPDAMILDLRMPGLGGFAFLERTSAVERLRPIPKVVFSTSELASDRSNAMSAGATDYVVKHMGYSVYGELLALLERLTNGSGR